MKPFGELISFDAALQHVLAASTPLLEEEMLDLLQAAGRVVSRDVLAPCDVPPFDRAAMDGYALQAASVPTASLEQPQTLYCLHELYAGEQGTTRVGLGQCVEIATGAPMPPGADAVVMVEQTRRQGAEVEVFTGVRVGQHVTRQGSDLGTGDVVVAAGSLLTPARIGALAAIGCARVACRRRPRVALGATGSEIVSPGAARSGAQIHDVNTWSLAALCQSLGCEVTMLPPTPDDREALGQTLEEALKADFVVLSGGSSVGDKDLLAEVCQSMGEVVFHGVAIKPGKPTMLARIGGKPVLGLPGYPTSCLSNGYSLLVPALCRMAGQPLPPRFRTRMPVATRLASMADKHHIVTVKVEGEAAVSVFKESGAITSMSRADGFIEIPQGQHEVAAGSMVEVTFFEA